MVLVTGGAYQGKSEFIERELVPKRPFANGETATFEELCACGCVMAFERWILRRMRAYGEKAELPEVVKELEAELAALAQMNPDLVVELQEMGCGVVPTDREERMYRECCGRAGCRIAAMGGAVYRLICGVAQRLQ